MTFAAIGRPSRARPDDDRRRAGPGQLSDHRSERLRRERREPRIRHKLDRRGTVRAERNRDCRAARTRSADDDRLDRTVQAARQGE
jgi:hypothetical protein